MADENTGTQPEPVAEIDIEAVDDLSPEESGKLLRGEVEPPRKGARVDAKGATVEPKDEFDIDPRSETVPHGQFHRVNERRKAAEAERQAERTRAEAAEARANTAMQRMAELLEASKPAQQQQEPAVDPNVYTGDPNDYVAKIDWLEQREAVRAEERKQWDAQLAQQTEVQRVIETKQAEYAAVREQYPEIEDARQAVLKGWHREFWLQGFRGAALDQKVTKAEADYTIWAHRQNIPIGDVIAELAMSRGWQPPTDDAQPATNGATQPKDPATGKFIKAAAEMDKREATRAAAKSLGGSGGPSDVGEMTPEMLVEMSEGEYAAWKKKNGGETALRKFFGARQ